MRPAIGRELLLSALAMAERGPRLAIAHVSCAFSCLSDPGSCTSSLRVIPPPSKSAKMVLHHTTMRGHGHDSTPCLLPTRDSGTSLALCHAALRLAKPKRSVTAAIGATSPSSREAQAVQRAQTLCGSHPTTALRSVRTQCQPSRATASQTTRSDDVDQPTPVYHRYLAALLSPCRM